MDCLFLSCSLFSSPNVSSIDCDIDVDNGFSSNIVHLLENDIYDEEKLISDEEILDIALNESWSQPSSNNETTTTSTTTKRKQPVIRPTQNKKQKNEVLQNKLITVLDDIVDKNNKILYSVTDSLQ